MIVYPPTVLRVVRDIDNDKRRKFLYSIPLDGKNSFAIPPVELMESIQLRLTSPSGKHVAIFRVDASKEQGNDKKISTLEVWSEYGQKLERIIDLTLAGKHGKVVADSGGNFGVPSWNFDETVIVYTAERPLPETSSFFDARKAENEGKKVIVGEKNTLGTGKIENWGEKYSSQSPLFDLFLVNVVTGKVGKVTNVPGASSVTTENGFTLGQPIFHPVDSQSIIYTAWDAGGGGEMPRRLGLIYCQQRPCQIYHSSVSKLLENLKSTEEKKSEEESITDAGFTCLTSSHRLSFSPRFSPLQENNFTRLIFLTSMKGFDTHSGCFALASIDDLNSSTGSCSAPNILVDQVWDPALGEVGAAEVAGMRFPGLFLQQLPTTCFVSPDMLLATSQWGSCQKIIGVSMKDGKVQLLKVGSEQSSEELLYVNPKRGAIVCTKTPACPAFAFHIEAKEFLSMDKCSKRPLGPFLPIVSTKFSPATLGNIDFTCKILCTKVPRVDGVDIDNPVQSILLLPDAHRHPNPPMIVVPHGGPHSVASTLYIPSYAFLCSHGGYAVLLVNYRGSTGFGQGMIEALPTRIGDMDVKDVTAVTREVADSGWIDPERIGICGGSHGGFLTAHATSQYPDMFRAAVMRNPVVNIASMVTSTDIPDWCYVEALGSYNWSQYSPMTRREMEAFYDMSPIRRIKDVKTPTLVALGMKDVRVPPSQGLEWFHALRSQKVPCKLLMYDNDDHAIDGVVSEADHWLNIKRWFDQYLK
jgi:acylaminoacyl-peptidase